MEVFGGEVVDQKEVIMRGKKIDIFFLLYYVF